MKKANKRRADPDMLPEYDFKNMVRGKYYGRLTKDSRVVHVSEQPLKGVSSSTLKAMRSKYQEIQRKVDELGKLIRAEERSAGRR